MKYVIPQSINFISTNVAEEALNEWVSGTVYNNSDEVKVSADKKKYKFAGVDGTTSTIPPKDDPVQWVGAPLNPYAMIDDTMSSKTTNADSIVVSFNATNIDTISLFNVQADTVQISLTDNTTSTIVFDETHTMSYDDLNSFGDYLFSEQELRDALTGNVTTATLDAVIAAMSEAQILDKFTASPPIYYDVKVDITITKTGGTAECGYLVVGRKRDLGVSLYGGSIAYKSTSTRDRNIWGEIELTQGIGYNTMDIPVVIDDVQVDVVEQRLSKILDLPCVFIGDESNLYQSMTIYGYYFDFEAPINPTKSTYNLRVESII